MTLEDLIYERITSATDITQRLAAFGNKPAVFYQNAPDDKADGWKNRKQYTRIDYIVDLQRNPERKTSGILTLNIWSAKDGTPPEEMEPIVRQLLCGVFLKPDNAPPYCLSWARSEPFDAQNNDTFVMGATLTFDVYAFPTQSTTDPDPVLAMNEFTKKLVPVATVIGKDDLASATVPTAEHPALYFRLETIQTQRETNTVAWMDAVIAGHVFAAGEETMWIRSIVDALALDGEITMLDTSPMFITTLRADNTLDATSAGQLRIAVRFGLLRRRNLSHVLLHANMEQTTKGGE